MLKKLFLSLVILVLTNNTLIKQVNAAGEIRCFVAQKTNSDFAKHSTGPNLDTTSTFASMAPLWGVPSQILFGAPLERVFPCAVDYLSTNLPEPGAITPGEGCEIEDQTVCEGMGIANIADQANYSPKGNLMGFVSSMERSLKDNIPVSLAYYVNQNAKKIPGINQTALAQDTVEYGGPFLAAIYHYWTISRNIAYAFLAAAMTVIGVMIVMGKSLDPKAGITVQQALPQIIIALILITFSYPIGAAGASLAFNVRGSITSWDLFIGADNTNNTAEMSAQTVILAFASALTPWAGLVSEGGGPLILLIAVVSAAISLIMSFLVLFKIFGIYLKMLFSILAAPVSFAIGAMPGNNDTTTNWFKQYGSYMLALPVMNFASWFVFQLSMDMSLKAFTSLDELGGWGFGRIAGLAIPVITAFGYSIVLTIPDKIDGMLGVKSK